MDLSRRGFTQLGGFAALAALMAKSGDALAAAPTIAGDPIRFVAPELRPAVLKGRLTPQPEFSDATLPQIRASAAAGMVAKVDFLPDVPVSKKILPVRSGIPDVPVYLINAKPGAKRPAIVYMHGGGFVGGTARQQVPRFQAFAAELDCTIVSVEYALAPDARYSTSLEQNYASLKWLYREADALGVDRERIAVMGESAGGGHAALLAFAARDRGEVPLVFQLLVYPCLDDRTGSTRQLSPIFGAIGWSASSNRFAWRSFLGVEPGGAKSPSAGVPARRTDLAGLPPTWIGVGGIDLLAPEALDHTRRLLGAGVPTELHLVPGAYHGFDKASFDTGLVKAFNASKVVALRRAFQAPTA